MAGKASYHIFLFQMLYFKIVGRSDYFDFIENIWLKSLATATCVMITLIINALGGYLVYLGIKRTKEQFITLKQNKPIHKFFEGS